VAADWYQGNAGDDAPAERGWILGHFIDPADSPRNTDAVEVKWGVHPAGEARPDWSTDQRATMVLLVSGRFHVKLRDTEVHLERQGDYLVWGPGTEHTWTAEVDSTVITVRWPSIPS
jgi:quercetin dioxygenase-like cupin family protein